MVVDVGRAALGEGFRLDVARALEFDLAVVTVAQAEHDVGVERARVPVAERRARSPSGPRRFAALEHVAPASREFGQGAGNVLGYLSFNSRLQGFIRGLIDTRDIVYFLSVTVLALVFSFRALERRKWA